MARAAKKQTKATGGRVRFKRVIKEQEQANLLVSGSKLELNGEYFYETSYHRTIENQPIYQDLDKTIKDNHYIQDSEHYQPPVYVLNSNQADEKSNLLTKTSQPTRTIVDDDIEYNDENKPRKDVRKTHSNFDEISHLSNLGPKYTKVPTGYGASKQGLYQSSYTLNPPSPSEDRLKLSVNDSSEDSDG